MSEVTDLVRAVLGEACSDDEQARIILDQALEAEVDPFDYFAHRYGLGKALVFSRAAAWAGLAFSHQIPHADGSRSTYHRLDSFAEVRLIRARLFDRDVSYAAPTFADLVRLRARVTQSPELHTRLCIVPDSAIRAELVLSANDALIDEARQRLARRWPHASAHLDLPIGVRVGFVALLAIAVLLAALAPYVLKPVLLPVLIIFLVLPALLRFAAAVSPLREPDPRPLSDAELPVYTVLIPLRDEANMVPLLHRAMTALDYPAEKLDIKFVVEARSHETIAAVKPILIDPRFELVSVPDAPPHTKPKALNYALPMMRGRYVVVFDAEDIPEPDQLRRAAARFAADPGLDCLQAVLDVDNADETWLSGLYAAEYAGLFGLLLPLMSAWRLPMPLGGTSNHFRSSALREVGGWDAFNVTEDADLGVRLARLRYRTATMSSRTGEEAPIGLGAWMAQRTRWMKGWMQTFIVHNRSPRRLLSDIGWRGFLAFEVYVGGLILAAPLHTVFTVSLCWRLATGGALGPGDGWDWAYLAVLIVGYGGAFALIVAGLLRSGRTRLLPVQLLLPVYWVLHSIAAVRAAHELLTRPYFWAKTPHGRTRMRR